MKLLLILVLCGCVLLFLFACTGPVKGFISFDQAVERVIQYLGLEETSQSTQTNRIIFYIGEVSTGDQIKEDDPFMPKADQLVAGNGYFFVVDLDPLARFAHPLNFIIVSKNPGEISMDYDALWGPTVNGTPTLIGEIYAADYEKNVWQNFTGNILSHARLKKESGSQLTTRNETEVEGSIVVNGNNPARYPDAGISTDADNMGSFYEGFTAAMSETQELAPPDNTEDDLRNAIQGMEDAGVNDCSIYIVTHGNSDVLVMGSSTMTAAEFSDMISDFPDITFKVIIDACKSGSFMDDLSGLSNVAIVLTATDSDKSSYGDIDGPSDPNPSDTGGEWTSGFLEDLEENTTSENWGNILEWAWFFEVSPKVILYYVCFDSAWEKDYARFLGLSNPQRYSPNYSE
ncbi:MAG TPA: C13 family peptidase [Thermotogota bacterium]|nr:C13 family peptidase [Thermotogota bacterium]HRW34736.1 C13 family peptidase [Thermotogota bacterium]